MGKGKRMRQASQVQETPAKAQMDQPMAKAKQQSSSAKRLSPRLIIVIVGVVAVVAIAVIAGRGANTATMVDGKVSRIIATVDECAFATIELQLPAEVSAEDAAAVIFDTLSTEAGVGLVTVYEDGPRVEIDYCQSYTSEPALREALAPTGYVTEQPVAEPAPAPAPQPESTREGDTQQDD